ncbi:hypothetical protein HQ32_03739 [Prauserella sp. Am3]|nr:hypothetical protein HQ32_03739 [Prauserella sp. Am3]
MAVSRDLKNPGEEPPRTRVTFPLIPATTPATVDITNDDIEAIVAAEDVEKYHAQ